MTKRLTYQPYRGRVIFNKLRHVDSMFWSEYTWNSYRGCAFGCVYCDARNMRYGMGAEFDTIIRFKENAAELALKQLKTLKKGLVSSGGVCDPYQPGEINYKITRGILEALLTYRFPVTVTTKSHRVVRDIELLKEIHATAATAILFTITTLDEAKVRLFEPGASPVAKRLAAMEQIACAGIPTGLSMMPLLPGITDTSDNIEQVVHAVKSAGGTFIIPGTLTLGGDLQKKLFFGALGERFPEHLAWYQQQYSRAIMTSYDAGRILLAKVRQICQSVGILDYFPRPILMDDPQAINHQIVELLMLACTDAYVSGRSSYSVNAYRRAAQVIEKMDSNVSDLYRLMGRDGLLTIKGVGQKIATLVENWLLTGVHQSAEVPRSGTSTA